MSNVPKTPPTRHPDAPSPGTVLASHYAYCFGCGADHPSGLHLAITVGSDVDLEARFTVTEAHQGAAGLVHGGLLAAAFDEALGALNWLLLRPAVTAHLETDFRRPVPVGTVLSISAAIDWVEGRKVHCSGTGRFPDGSVAATASGLFVQVPLEHFSTHGWRQDPVGLELNP